MSLFVIGDLSVISKIKYFLFYEFMKNCEEFHKSIDFLIIELYHLISKKSETEFCIFPYKHVKVYVCF